MCPTTPLFMSPSPFPAKSTPPLYCSHHFCHFPLLHLLTFCWHCYLDKHVGSPLLLQKKQTLFFLLRSFTSQPKQSTADAVSVSTCLYSSTLNVLSGLNYWLFTLMLTNCYIIKIEVSAFKIIFFPVSGFTPLLFVFSDWSTSSFCVNFISLSLWLLIT